MDSSVPLWVALVLGLSPSLVAIAAIVAAEVRERRRLGHELKSRLRDERIEAYRKLLTATSTAHFYDPEAIRAIAKAYNEIALLAETPELAKAAQAAWFAYGDTQRAHKNVKEDPEVSTATDYTRAIAISEDARRRFLDLARKELGVEGRSEEFLNLEALPPEDTFKGPKPPASQP